MKSRTNNKKEFKCTRWWTRRIMETGKFKLGYMRHCNEQQLKMKSRTNNKKEFKCTRWWTRRNLIMETGKFQVGFMRHCNEHWQRSETKVRANNKKEFTSTSSTRYKWLSVRIETGRRHCTMKRLSPNFWWRFNVMTLTRRSRCRVSPLNFGFASGSTL